MWRHSACIGLLTASLFSAVQAADQPDRTSRQQGSQVEPTSKPVHELQVIAGRFSYDPATVRVTAGERVRLVIRSKDTIHGFSIPKLNIDTRIPKVGEPVVVEFMAPPAGRFEIACSEFCGSGHKQMKAELISIAPTITNQ
jgi:cytochrome c oxidase subunit II